jgi:diguanylate cyclase (GGDEF)-like protein
LAIGRWPSAKPQHIAIKEISMNVIAPTPSLETLLPLDASERVVAFGVKGKKSTSFYTCVFPRIAKDVWEKYYGGIYLSRESDGNDETRVVDLESSGIDMVGENVLRVEGYPDEFMRHPEWKSLLPIGHAKLAFWLLHSAIVDTDYDTGAFNPLRIAVALKASWGVQKNEKGQPGMMHYTGLVHYFNPPNAAQKHRYSRAMSESKIVGGSRSGKTLSVPKQALLLLDLDGFKDVNDSLGYDVGDRILIEVGDILRELPQHVCYPSRLGGAEFLVFITNWTAPKYPERIAEKIISKIEGIRFIDEIRVDVTASIGIEYTEEERVDKKKLIKYSNIAMHKARGNGRNSYFVHYPYLQKE